MRPFPFGKECACKRTCALQGRGSAPRIPCCTAAISAPVTVTGTASDQHLAYYQLLLAPAGNNNGNTNWSELARGYQNVVNGTLGTFDPTQLQNGIYSFARLTSLFSD